jgi:hypothetical protein
MFCPKCGTQNQDGSAFCVNCGNRFGQVAPPTEPTTQPSSQPFAIPPPSGEKNPVLAAILNFLFPGIGYWYWGYRKVVTLPPVLLFILVIVVEYAIWYFLLYAGIILLLINVFFAYDLWVKTTGQRGWIEATR